MKQSKIKIAFRSGYILLGTHRPDPQSFSFQNDEPFPFALHSRHARRPLRVHHHHFDPRAGFARVPHFRRFQKSESFPFFWHFFHSARPDRLQNHHPSLYISKPRSPDEPADEPPPIETDPPPDDTDPPELDLTVRYDRRYRLPSLVAHISAN